MHKSDLADISGSVPEMRAVKPASVRLELMFPGEIPLEMATACLSLEELARAGRFRFPADRDTWVGWRAGLRRILARELECPPREVPLTLSEFGKPLLAPPHEGLHFNLSHCHGLALIAISHEGPVGVDLEPRARATDLLGCEKSFCHPQEINGLCREPAARAKALLRIWCGKEAVLKALGTGFQLPPETFRLHFDNACGDAIPDTPDEGLSGQRLHLLRHASLTDFQAVVSAPRSVGQIEWVGRDF